MAKYPSWSPYNYGLDNPIKNIDPNGDSIDVSQLNASQLKGFNQNIQNMQHSQLFSKIWKTLSDSKAVYKISVDPNQKETAQYQPNSDETGSGGILSFQNTDAMSETFTFSHESFHAYESDQYWPGSQTIGSEVSANVAAVVVTSQLNLPGITGSPNENPAFSSAFDKLVFGNQFNGGAWKTANQLFKVSGFNQSHKYDNFNLKLYNPVIKYLYPLNP